MDKVYVEHDGDSVTMASTVTLSGHVTVGPDSAKPRPAGAGSPAVNRPTPGPGAPAGNPQGAGKQGG